MAVNIDTVYQRVLAIANKEQRGYITPQEFNLLANQAQMQIFEQYFYDITQFERIPGNAESFADPIEILEEKIALFEYQNVTVVGGTTLSADLYRLNNVLYNGIEADYVSIKDWMRIKNHPLLRPHDNRPIYTRKGTGIEVFGHDATDLSYEQKTSNVTCDYIKIPTKVEWAYTVVPFAGSSNNEYPLYNSANAVNFELHRSEETSLIFRILELAGVMIKDPDLYQAGSSMKTQEIQQEKQ